MDFCEIDMEEEEEVTPEDEAYYKCVDLLLAKYPEAKHRRGKLADIPNDKSFVKFCYSVIYDERDGFTVRGFMICALDIATHSNAIMYRSDNP